MFTYSLYAMALLLYLISLIKSKEKTKMALKKSYKMFVNILPQLLAIFVLVGILLALIDQTLISKLIGWESGLSGVLLASLLGAVTLMPGFVAFPLASNLLEHGAGIAQIAAFVSSLMMVGIATFSLEAKTLGKRVALLRNVFAFIYSFIIAIVIGGVLA